MACSSLEIPTLDFGNLRVFRWKRKFGWWWRDFVGQDLLSIFWHRCGDSSLLQDLL